ncbi:MAG: His-Xaa-Ser system radical SAM maturase HxsC [Thermodesulfobacteriota bacterium]
MLTLQGISKNIKEPIIGKLSFSPVEKEEIWQTIYVISESIQHELKGCIGLVVRNNEIEDALRQHNLPLVYNVKNIDLLSDGDVIEILPNGLINVLYRINSDDNLIFVTSKCDCKCIMCPQPIDYDEGDLTELNLKLISSISTSTKELALTGGEPTIVGNDLFRLILACKNLLPDTSLLLLTNGRKFSNFEYTHIFSSIGHPDITIGIALYGDNDIEHDFIVGSKGAFNDTVRGIINLASFSNPIEIRIVTHKFTYNRLLRISDFIYRNMTFVKHIVFMGLETIWRARENLKILWIEPEELIPHLEEAIHYLIQRGMNVSIYNIPLCLLPEKFWIYARKSITGWKNSFDLKCFECSVKEECSGLFDSGVDIYRKYLKPIY